MCETFPHIIEHFTELRKNNKEYLVFGHVMIPITV